MNKSVLGRIIPGAFLVMGLVWGSTGLFLTPAAAASGKYNKAEFGKTLPPVGFVKFCAGHVADCKVKISNTNNLEMTPERWDQLSLINSAVNSTIAPMSDNDLYGQPELWTYPTDAGDCEDYVLLKKRDLVEQGFNPATLLITVVLDEKGEGHAVLMVSTNQGDFILDNRRDDIKRWDGTNYKFLKRQSKSDPLQWVSLIKQETTTTGFVASGN